MNNANQCTQHQLAAIFVHRQEYSPIYPPCEALKYGTVFSTLNQPYCPKKKR